jgi:hypothetical protein
MNGAVMIELKMPMTMATRAGSIWEPLVAAIHFRHWRQDVEIDS